MKIKVGIVGATGYTGELLLQLLNRHSEVVLTLATSEKFAGKKVRGVFPHLTVDLVLQPLSDKEVTRSCQFVFSCLPHKDAAPHVAHWVQKGLKVVDLSADFRFRSQEIYEQWYQPHPSPKLLKEAVYGLPEIYRKEIRKATLVSNPGCYPTGALLGLLPLVKEGLISLEGIIIDAKSGISGAGRSTVEGGLRKEAEESVHAYKVGIHRHTPEIEQELSLIAGEAVTVSFTPHLIPMDRGILTTIYVKSLRKIDTKRILQIFSDFYRKEPFVKVLPEGTLPKTKEARGTNDCLIGAVSDPRTRMIIVVTAIDNLMKGASSQAVQNMNLMSGFPETTGLNDLPLVP